MATDNSWGAPRIHGELLCLGFDVSERFVATVRRELLDHVIVLNERHLRRLLESFIGYCHQDRTHLGLGKDSPRGRRVERRLDSASAVVGLPRVGGLHQRYAWRQAA